MRTPGIDERERLMTLSALASVVLILGLATDPVIGGIAALCLLLLSLFLPVPAAWFVAGWKAITHRLFGVVMSILLVLVHLLVLTPIGLLRRMCRQASQSSQSSTMYVEADEPQSGPDQSSWDRPG